MLYEVITQELLDGRGGDSLALYGLGDLGGVDGELMAGQGHAVTEFGGVLEEGVGPRGALAGCVLGVGGGGEVTRITSYNVCYTKLLRERFFYPCVMSPLI